MPETRIKRMFGTDGVRGVAGKSPLTPQEINILGRSAGAVLKKRIKSKQIRVLAVRDTRESGRTILKYLSDGFRDLGVDVYDAGILTTPSVAYLVKAHHFDSGIVISASHNPPEFNGIKFFNHLSRKWPDAWEEEVEAKFEHYSREIGAIGTKGNLIRRRSASLIEAHSLYRDYEEFLISTIGDDADFSGFRVALDCSNGANSEVAPELFRQLGATVYVVGANPNGKNINVNCGSQHTERLSKLVKEKKCDIGIAFDGDGDRVVFVDEKGRTLDGDHAIAFLAKCFKEAGILKNNLVVITVMANLGLKKALTKLKIKTEDVSVGDRFVSEMMKKKGSVLGGEQSGHIILGKHLPTGDGLLTALHTLKFLQEKKKPVSALLAFMKKFPQYLLNLPVKERTPLSHLPGVQELIQHIENVLGDNGRVLVRYSGTEPLLRIMLEGPSKSQLVKFANQIADTVKKAESKTKEPALVIG